MWAHSEQITASFGPRREPSMVDRATMLAPVPLKARRVITSASNNSEKAASTLTVWAS